MRSVASASEEVIEYLLLDDKLLLLNAEVIRIFSKGHFSPPIFLALIPRLSVIGARACAWVL